MKVTIPFTLDSERDRDILDALGGEPNRSAAVRESLREHYGQVVTLAVVFNEIIALRDEVQAIRRAGLVVGPGAEPASDEPADLAAALDDLGK